MNQDFLTGLQALTFGKSSTKGAREYYDNGYKQVLPENMGPNQSRSGAAASNSVESVPAQQEAEESWFDRLFPVFKGGRNEAAVKHSANKFAVLDAWPFALRTSSSIS